MSVRGLIRERLYELAKIGKEAKDRDDQATMVDAMIRRQELELLYNKLRKK